MSDPLQELAEKLRKLRYTVPPCAAPASWGTTEPFRITLYPAGSEAPLLTEQQIEILAPIVGTLLQAERAAGLQIAAEHFPITGESWNVIACSCGWECKDTQKPATFPLGIAEWKAHISSLAPASALAAVVQRETEKLRELLRETAEARHMLHGGDWNGDTFERPVFENCASPLCVLARAALK